MNKTSGLEDHAANWIRDCEARGFHKLCRFRVLTYGQGKASVELLVSADVENPAGTLHGGVIATLIDQAGTIAILSVDREGRPGVSTDLNVSFLAPAEEGATVVADATVLKVGRNLAFVTVDVRRAGDGALVARGRMTKYQAGSPPA